MERLRRVIPYLLPFPSDPASAVIHCAPAGHAPRSVSAPMILRSRDNVYLSSSKEVVFQLLIRGMSLPVLARIGVRVTRPGRRRICGSIVFGQNALLPMVQGLEDRPLWGRAVYTALHGARLSSVPSGDQSANPASVLGHSGLQRAFLSVSSAQKCSGAWKHGNCCQMCLDGSRGCWDHPPI